MVQGLGTSATLADYPSLIPSTHICWLTIACNSNSGDLISLTSMGT